MILEQEILFNQFGQGVYESDKLVSQFESLDIEGKRSMIKELENLIIQSKSTIEDVDEAISKSGLKSTFTPCASVFSTTLSEDYVNVSDNPNAWNYGNTLVRFGDENGNSTHGATYLGTSENGTQYFWTKNGRVTAPVIMNLEKLKQMWGDNQGVGNDNNGGYYNYEP